jgi:NADH:ubiquinone oxidoreductase subunit C
MTNDELKIKLLELNPTATFEEGGEWMNVLIEVDQFLQFVKSLKEESSLYFDFLFCLTCIDWKTHLSVVYHFTSTQFRHNLVVKVKLNREQPEIETLSHLWRTAEFHEREVFELFGVQFLHHPDLRKLILTDDFIGYPLRKDFEDPINMIKL